MCARRSGVREGWGRVEAEWEGVERGRTNAQFCYVCAIDLFASRGVRRKERTTRVGDVEPGRRTDASPAVWGSVWGRAQRPAPTSVPGALPAFRGRENTPGSAVGAPAIRSSYNRQNRGTNQTVVYARTVNVEEPRSYGHVSEETSSFTHFSPLPLSPTQKRSSRLSCLQGRRSLMQPKRLAPLMKLQLHASRSCRRWQGRRVSRSTTTDLAPR